MATRVSAAPTLIKTSDAIRLTREAVAIGATLSRRREAARCYQGVGLGQWQSDNVGIGADDRTREDGGAALHGVTASFAQSLLLFDVMRNFRIAETAER